MNINLSLTYIFFTLIKQILVTYPKSPAFLSIRWPSNKVLLTLSTFSVEINSQLGG